MDFQLGIRHDLSLECVLVHGSFQVKVLQLTILIFLTGLAATFNLL